ncbi:hypothetical protein HAX54_016986 [Datura stramonium]|uniref:glutathione transferase n=1 Tax=Datura stramonium TaxID=4076 RepID=A0ABS8ULC3_DATST|nr:hypothetical protein [Datura stramonium]
MVVKLHGSAMAACPQRVMVCLIELGVDFELIHVDLDSLQHKKPDFLVLQPPPSLGFVMNEGGFAHLVTERKSLHDWYLDISSRPSWNKVLDLMNMKKSEMSPGPTGPAKQV